MIFQVRSSEHASEALSYFNHFHDSFIESIFVKVIPADPEGFGYALPVRHDVILSFIHSNYEAVEGNENRQQGIKMHLGRVREMNIGNMVPVDNMIQECCIEVNKDGNIRIDVGGDGLITFVSDSLTIEEN